MKPYTWGDRPVQDIHIRTKHPEDYMLLNFADETAWGFDENGRTVRLDWPKVMSEGGL